MKTTLECLMLGCDNKVKNQTTKYCETCKKSLETRAKYYKGLNKGRLAFVEKKGLRDILNRMVFYSITLFLILTFNQSIGLAETINVGLLVNKICLAESSNRAHLVGDNGKSRGLMQIQKNTWVRYTDISYDQAFDPKINRAIGTLIVKDIIRKYGAKATISKVIFTYNSGIFIKRSLPAKWTINHPNKIYRELHRNDQHNNVIDL